MVVVSVVSVCCLNLNFVLWSLILFVFPVLHCLSLSKYDLGYWYGLDVARWTGHTEKSESYCRSKSIFSMVEIHNFLNEEYMKSDRKEKCDINITYDFEFGEHFLT